MASQLTGSTGSDDCRAIFERLCELALAFDQRDWAAVGALFSSDATAYGIGGRTEIVAGARSKLGGCGPSQHLLGNQRIEVRGDQASSRVYVRAFHKGKGERSLMTFEVLGEYQDTWLRTPEGWQITGRTFDVFGTSGDGSVMRPG